MQDKQVEKSELDNVVGDIVKWAGQSEPADKNTHDIIESDTEWLEKNIHLFTEDDMNTTSKGIVDCIIGVNSDDETPQLSLSKIHKPESAVKYIENRRKAKPSKYLKSPYEDHIHEAALVDQDKNLVTYA